MGSGGRFRLVVLASGGGTNLQAILDACHNSTIPADVVAVVSDHHDAGALDRARRARVETVFADPKRATDRRAYDAELAQTVSVFQPDVVVLAGWMRMLSSAFLDRFPNRVVNLHPALPGELPGLHAIDRAFQEFTNGTRTRSGVMVHLVPDELMDAGPVLAAVEVPFQPGDSLDTFERRIHEAEHGLLVRVLASLCSIHPEPIIKTEATR